MEAGERLGAETERANGLQRQVNALGVLNSNQRIMVSQAEHETADAKRLLKLAEEIAKETEVARDAAQREVDRLHAALVMLSQCRHVSGSAQGAFRSNLAIVDAVLQGADVRDVDTVLAITDGTWKPNP